MSGKRQPKDKLRDEVHELRDRLARLEKALETSSQPADADREAPPDIAAVGEHGVLVTGPEGRLHSARPAAATILRRPDGTVLYTLHSDVADGEGAHALRTTASTGSRAEAPAAPPETLP